MIFPNIFLDMLSEKVENSKLGQPFPFRNVNQVHSQPGQKCYLTFVVLSKHILIARPELLHLKEVAASKCFH